MRKPALPPEAIEISRNLKNLMDENDRKEREEMDDQESLSLAARLCAVMQEVATVGKTGRNDFHNYDYMTADDITKHVRPLFAKHGIVLIPSVTSHAQDVIGEGQKSSLHTVLTVEYTLLADGAEPIKATWVSEGEDGADKGTAKALTANLKTFLAKLLQIDTGDDPEADTKTDERAAARGAGERTPRQVSGSGRPATDKQMGFMKILIDKKEMPAEDEDVLRQKVREHESGAIKMEASEASDWIARLKALKDRELIAAPARDGYDDAPPHTDESVPF